jgi:hypothetical protein
MSFADIPQYAQAVLDSVSKHGTFSMASGTISIANLYSIDTDSFPFSCISVVLVLAPKQINTPRRAAPKLDKALNTRLQIYPQIMAFCISDDKLA